jgi:ATP-dependent Clp protease ATP-binding subunit ClpA
MDFERYTERARNAVQSAQTSALAAGHPQLTPEHILKALFNDRDRLALNLIRAAGGDPDLAQANVEKLLAERPVSLFTRSRMRSRSCPRSCESSPLSQGNGELA